MNFQDLKKIEPYQFYLDVAFRSANDKVDLLRSITKKRENKLDKTIRLEQIRIDVIREKLAGAFQNITLNFPSLDSLPEFYDELIRCSLDYDKIKKSLGAANWARQKIIDIALQYKAKMNTAKQIPAVITAKKAFIGRVSSIVKQIRKNLEYLETARMEMRDFPSIKTSMFTIAITGFPNVGKSTLLKKLTNANPEINSYAFTTKTLNLGYAHIEDQKIQVVDTPGTLNRYQKMNSIEKKAHLVMKYLANMIVYVFDLSEPYPLEKQRELFKTMLEFDKPLIIYLSKSDILDKKLIENFAKECNGIYDIELLETEIAKELEGFF
ncbi:GTP-binding protein [Candidatus Woesearchaeota archaeon]|nr:MAG: GTP-binding protein [Candidatus Woesearchaeota archaeon]